MSIESGAAAPAPVAGEQTVNAPQAEVNREISSLANFRARQAGSSPATPATDDRAGAAGPNTGATPQPEREQFIPRDRFDEVVQERNREREQAAQLQAQLALYQQQMAQRQQAPVQQNITGMVGAAPQAPQLPDFNDATVKKQWSERIYKDPIGGIRELVSLLIRAEGEPLLNQFQQQIVGQITPLQQSFLSQQLQGYEQSRSAADPVFSQIAPTFRALATQAVQRGIPLDNQSLQAIEGLARAQAGVPFTAPAVAPTQPFTERPGGQANFGQPQRPSLTQAERAVAERFGMSEQEYAGWFGTGAQR